jgi:uncharacterized protein YggE
MPYGVESLKSDAASLATPIIAGEQDISMTVSIVFLLGE